ncbi:MAG: ABC transporter ATP-binding protein [Actinomycetales bacterium]|nr:ABC transporter ATP-binding protein [Candidatus Phosphoribacter baldrii]MBK6955304.1 ABC transporter ATP-binding protein [Candidatus Phosphoribacter baldrii]MBK7610574.1 ABC transporter ATP-binding protein [Candidatus Phosphoribacter baldrii]
MSILEAHDLRRTFTTTTGVLRRNRKEVEAVRGVSFAIEPGELFGLLGPNGAGKTTTIKMLITLLLPTSGSATILGLDVVRDAREVRRQIGYVFGGDRGLYERLSALDNLRYFAELYAVPARDQRARIGELLELVGLTGREKERVEGFSRGMRQRLHIARGLLHDPALLFLDEPSIGIDPVGARELRQTIAGLRDQGKTILLTTHYMFEADELCDRIAVIRTGELVAQGTPAQLKARVTAGSVVEVETFSGVGETDVRGRVGVVGALAGVRSVVVDDGAVGETLVVQVEPGADVTAAVLGALRGIRVGRVVTREPTLEDAYVQLVSS